MAFPQALIDSLHHAGKERPASSPGNPSFRSHTGDSVGNPLQSGIRRNGTDLKWQYKATGLPIEKQFITYDMNEVKEYWATDATALKAFAAGNDLRNRDKDYSTVGENAVYINVWAYEPGWTVSVTENGTPLAVKQVWSKKDPLHSISYDIPRGAVNNGTLTFPSTSCMHMFEVTASSASSTLEISVTDRFGNVSTESMTRPKALTTDVTK